MRVAIVGTRGIPLGYSGYETLAEKLSLWLVAQGYRVTVYAHRHMFRERPPEYRGVKLVYVNGLRGKSTSQFSTSLLATLHVICRRYQLVFFCNAANGPFGLLLRLFGKKCIINVDGLEWQRPKWGPWAKRFFRFGAWCACRFFHRVVTDARAMKEIYQREFGCSSEEIAYGADILQNPNVEIVRGLGLEPFQYYLIVGRFIPDNNIDLQVRAFLKSRIQKKLVVVGGAYYRNPYEENIKKAADPRLLFAGYIHDQEKLNALYGHAYAYLHGHEFGGTNPALLRALGCGCCVLALDTVFNREVLQDGRFGILFEKNVDRLQAALEKADTEPEWAASFRAVARQRIREAYTWEKICGQYQALFEKVAQGKRHD